MTCNYCAIDPNTHIKDYDYFMSLTDPCGSVARIVLVPFRHISSIFDCTSAEKKELFLAIKDVCDTFKAKFNVASFNIKMFEGNLHNHKDSHFEVIIVANFL